MPASGYNGIYSPNTGGVECASAVSGVTAQSGVIRVGSYAWEISGAGDSITFDFDHGTFTNAFYDHICGFWWRTDDTTPAGEANIFTVLNTLAATNLTLVLETDGDVHLADSNGTIQGTATTPLTVDTWHFIEVYYNPLSSGAFTVWLDGNSIITGLGDFETSNQAAQIKFERASSGSSIFYLEDIYSLSDGNGVADRLGDWRIKPYQNATASQVADIGDNAEVGNWDDAGNTPANDGTSVDYIGNPKSGGVYCDNGSRSGPNGDSDVGAIEAALWVWRAMRGGGGGTTHKMLVGNSGDGLTGFTHALTTSFVTYLRGSAAASILPLSTEYAAWGMDVNGGQDISVSDAWVLVGFVPSSGFGGHVIIY